MREIQYRDYLEEIDKEDKEFRNLVKKLYKPISKKYCEDNGLTYQGVPDNLVLGARRRLKNEGKYQIGEVTFYAEFEKVRVIRTYDKEDYDTNEGLRNDIAEMGYTIIGVDEGKLITEFIVEMFGFRAESDNELFKVFTASEAATKWGLNESTVRKAISYDKFIPIIEYRKAGGNILITKEAMERLYGILEDKR